MNPYACLIVAIALAAPSLAGTAAPRSDPKAVAVAGKVMKALGGEKHWNELKGVRWSFGSEVGDTVKSVRKHAWDKHSGWHRVEGKNRAGQPFLYIENLNDSTQGMAWVDGVAIEGDSLRKLLKLARRLWTNDSYWFLMPYKLRDPGVILKHEGTMNEGDVSYEKIGMSFDNVGQTPGDRYWVFVNSRNNRIEKWEYLLEGDQPPAQTMTWESWEEHGGLWFPTAHRREKLNVFTRDVEAVSAFRPEEFKTP